MSKQLADLREAYDLFEDTAGPGRVDRARGLVRGVRILTFGNSKNNNDYAPGCVDPKLYEGRAISIDHPDEGKRSSAYHRLGRVVNVRQRGNGIFGDLEILKSHPLGPAVLEAAERFPSLYGLSHRVARGDYRGSPKAGGGVKVEGISRVAGLEIVAEPSSNKGLFESQKGGTVTRTLRTLVARLVESRPRAGRALREYAESGIMGTAGTDTPLTSSGDDEADVNAAFENAVAAVVRARLPLDQSLRKIKAILTAREKVGSAMGNGSSSSTAADDGSPVAAESWDRRGSFGDLEEFSDEQRRERVSRLRRGHLPALAEGEFTDEERKARVARLRQYRF